MKLNYFLSVFSVFAFISSPSYAQMRGQTVTAEGGEYRERTLKDQKWGVTPQIGVLVYEDAGGSSKARAAIGGSFDWNATKLVLGDDPMGSYIGLSVSGLYSHPGPNDADFFGSGSSAGGGSNLVQIPFDVKVGGYFSDSVRFTVRGGGNLIYRSDASAINLGAGSDSTGSLWKVYPNVGLEGEYKVSEHISILARPDLTITPGKNLFVATVGATFLGF